MDSPNPIFVMVPLRNVRTQLLGLRELKARSIFLLMQPKSSKLGCAVGSLGQYHSTEKLARGYYPAMVEDLEIARAYTVRKIGWNPEAEGIYLDALELVAEYYISRCMERHHNHPSSEFSTESPVRGGLNPKCEVLHG